MTDLQRSAFLLPRRPPTVASCRLYAIICKIVYIVYTKKHKNVYSVNINDLTRDSQAPLAPYNDEEGSFFKVYVADTGVMFSKFGIAPSLFLNPELQASLSSDFRGALAENYVMQALKAAGLKTFYWMPEENAQRGEIDFIYQTKMAEVIPVEVKSARNVSAKTFSRFMKESRAPFGVRLSENEFGCTKLENGAELRSLPLYAAFCMDGMK